jgi:hypothetical protein
MRAGYAVNDPDQRPGASDPDHGKPMQSGGSLSWGG